MRIFKFFLCILICICVCVLPSCKGTGGSSKLRIGVEGITGEFNPFYAETDADRKIVMQMFRSVQRPDANNKLVNYAGGISYEYIGDTQIEYTVSINKELRFSDGTNITIDDVIFFYHFIADASYDGYYKGWYLNDIEGLKEYYFDDENYESSIRKIEEKIEKNYTLTTIETSDYVKYLSATMLEGKFDGNLDSVSPSGESWEKYLLRLGYAEALDDLGSNPSQEKINKLVATAEAESNPLAYNPEDWYREKLYAEYIEGNYKNGMDVESISGIKKVDDYTCTVLFSSHNVNAVSQLNALLVSKAAFSAEYVKGEAEKVKQLGSFNVASGPYVLKDYDIGTAVLSYNEFYAEPCDFTSLEFVDISDEKDPVKLVASGRTDIIETYATAENINRLSNENVSYFIEDCNYYVSLFLNTRKLDLSARKALIGVCDVNAAVEARIGSYYTRPLRPISVRFDEYPMQITEPYHSESAFTVYNMGSSEKIKEADLYYCGSEDDLAYAAVTEYKNVLAEKGIALNIVVTDENTLNSAILSGKADMWVEKVYDGASCDKFDYYNSAGQLNKTGINRAEIDMLTASIRSATGYSNKADMTARLMELVMEEAVECPLYQQQKMTVCNTETISPDSFDNLTDTDDFTYIIPLLKKK